MSDPQKTNTAEEVCAAEAPAEPEKKKKEKRPGLIAAAIVLAFAALVTFTLLELGQNMVIGWILAAELFLVFFLFLWKIGKEHTILKVGAWILLAVLIVSTVIFTGPPYRSRPATDAKNPEKTAVYTVSEGQLTGVYTDDKQVEVFCGVPYAAPPVGELRWKEPQDPAAWEGVRAADHFAPMSMQQAVHPIVGSLVDMIGYHQYKITAKNNFKDLMSEDSLYLNIWKPAGETKDLPVLVYIHGGSLQTGQPWYADYSGQGLARQGVIVVNMGYRLGAFGFFADEELQKESPHGTTGNYGLLDQIKALTWVQKNIAAFGGDPGNVTLSGESAGSACVSALLTSPLAKGLFRRAVLESSTVTAPEPAHSYRTLEDALTAGRDLKAHFGAQTLSEMRAVSAEKMTYGANDNHHITVDGYVLTESPYESLKKGICNAEVILHGYNAKEGALFILLDPVNNRSYSPRMKALLGDKADAALQLYPQGGTKETKANWEEVYSAHYFEYGHYCLTRQARACGVPVYEYFFTKENKRLGANHGGEEVYLYGNTAAYPKHYDESDKALETVMSGYMVNFIRYGDPNGAGLPEWKPSVSDSEIFELGANVGTIERKRCALLALFDEKYGFAAKD